MLKKVTSALLSDAEAEGKKLVKEAEKEVEKLITDATKEGKKKVNEAERIAKKMLNEERRERISWANLESRKLISEAKDEVVKEAISKLITRLKSFRNSKKYASWLKQKVKEAINEVGRGVVHVRKGDGKLLRGMKVKVKEDADILGGAIVSSANGKIQVDFSFDTLLSVKKDEIRAVIYRGLFK